MIISASRRTDVPAWHARWLMEQLRAGKTRVKNPFHPAIEKEVILRKEDVDCIVFLKRNESPHLHYLE